MGTISRRYNYVINTTYNGLLNWYSKKYVYNKFCHENVCRHAERRHYFLYFSYAKRRLTSLTRAIWSVIPPSFLYRINHRSFPAYRLVPVWVHVKRWTGDLGSEKKKTRQRCDRAKRSTLQNFRIFPVEDRFLVIFSTRWRIIRRYNWSNILQAKLPAYKNENNRPVWILIEILTTLVVSTLEFFESGLISTTGIEPSKSRGILQVGNLPTVNLYYLVCICLVFDFVSRKKGKKPNITKGS